MQLIAGTRLGPYEVAGPVSDTEGRDMYRAKDIRLGRNVAIRILPPGIADTPTGRSRLERATIEFAQLNHPSICGIYDVGEYDGVSFLVMEEVDGESLEARLKDGLLPWQAALTIGAQIAGALSAAHKRGIVHRGLKPSNVVLVGSAVKLLDFGIAALTEPMAVDDSPTDAKTTAEHPIGGTLNYMSPEQLDGREVDARADIFALGAVLYEMLTGRKAFDGESATSVATAVMTAVPGPIGDMTKGLASPPPALNHVVERAMAKRRQDRWQTARDLQLELQWLLDASARAAVASTSSHRVWRLAQFGLAAAALLTVGILGGRFARLATPGAPLPRETVFTITLPEGLHFGSQDDDLIAVSPDSKQIVFVARDKSKSTLWLRKVDEPYAHSIPGTDNAEAPFWSPNSESIAFFVGGNMSAVVLPGELPRLIAKLVPVGVLAPGTTGCWLSDAIVFTSPSGLSRVAASGGAGLPVTLRNLARGDERAAAPSPLDNGAFLYLVRHSDTSQEFEGRIGVMDGAPKPLPSVHSNAVFAGGYLIFRQGDALVAQKFDGRARALLGEPVVIAQHVAYDAATAQTAFAASDNLLAYRQSGSSEKGITVVLNWMARVR